MITASSHRRLIPFTLAAVVFGLACAHPALAGLRDDVDRAVRSAPLKGGIVAVSIRDAESGFEFVSINAESAMIPASNMKLLTTGAALHALGANFSFQTRMVRDASNRLVIIGDGDPAFGDPALLALMHDGNGKALETESFLNLWVKPVVESGITSLSELVVDDRIFDRDFVHPDWPVEQLNKRYCAEVAGLTYNLNLLDFYPRPRVGQSPEISDIRPAAGWLSIANSATSLNGPHDSNTIWISRKTGTNDLKVHGNVKRAYEAPVQVTLHDMPSFFGRLLADRLAAAGVSPGVVRTAQLGDPEFTGTAVGPIISTPLVTVINRCNQESQNLYAECLLKRAGAARTGQPGSWINGAAIVRHILQERLANPSLVAGTIIADGSGLSRENRVAARTMTAWLRTFHEDDTLGPLLINSLAVANESGTLEKRFDPRRLHGAKVQAKTGFIDQVSCLSGFITMPDGSRRIFSILVNGLKGAGTVSAAKALQEKIVIAIADDMAEADVPLGGR